MAVRLQNLLLQYLSRASSPDYNGLFTFFTAFRLTSFSAGNLPLFNLTFDQSNQERIILDINQLVVGRVRDTAVSFDVSSKFPVKIKRWYYAAYERLSLSTTELFLGDSPSTLVSQGTVTHTLGGTRTSGNPAISMEIGGYATFSQYLNGRVRGPRLWTANLSENELQAEAASLDAAVRTADLWGAWNLKYAGTYTDDSGNSRPLTAINGPLTTEADPGAPLEGEPRSLHPLLIGA